MKTSKHRQLNAQIYSEASDWLVEFRSSDIDPAGRKEFYAWLRRSPEHMRAYLELAAIWNEGASLDPDRVFAETDHLSNAAAEDNVIDLTLPLPREGLTGRARESARITNDDNRPPRSGRVGPTTWRVSLAVAASILLLGAGMGGWIYLHRGVYSTGIGEQRAFALSDGSRIGLNARSKVHIRYSSTERLIELLEGQALFHVAKDENRPLVVTSNDTQVRAIGTQFDVYRKNSDTIVSVLEGRVAVVPISNDNTSPGTGGGGSHPREGDAPRAGGTGEATTLLSAGEQAVITAQATVKQVNPNVSAATAWTRGRIVFEGTALQEVADEFNRYNPRQLVVRDPQLANFKITGTFSSTDPSSLLRFLADRPGIAVTESGDEILISGK